MNLRLIEASDDCTHLALNGRLDIAGASAIETQFTAHIVPRKKPALIDISGVDFVSSLGIRMFLNVAKALEANGARMVLINPQPNIRETLELSQIDDLIPIAASKEEALPA